MQATEPSRTAMITAVCRGRHRLSAPPPWVIDDPYALCLVGTSWSELEDTLTASLPLATLRGMRAGMVVRTRYVEDRLEAGSFGQYVILGAGLDSFAWRRPDLLKTVRVFEVDHPDTQAWKQQRANTLALPRTPRHVFAPLEFERGTLSTALTSTGFDWSEPTCFSWLGVTQYLSIDAITTTLRTVASCAPGSEIVLSYIATSPFLDELGHQFVERISTIAAESGEPWQTFFSPTDAEEVVAHDSALTIREHLDPDHQQQRYFAERSDGLTPYTVLRFITAAVVR